jgi:hypothetical protein
MSDITDLVVEIEKNKADVLWLEGVLDHHLSRQDGDLPPDEKEISARIIDAVRSQIDDRRQFIFEEELDQNKSHLPWLEQTLMDFQEELTKLPSSRTGWRSTLEGNCDTLRGKIGSYRHLAYQEELEKRKYDLEWMEKTLTDFQEELNRLSSDWTDRRRMLEALCYQLTVEIELYQRNRPYIIAMKQDIRRGTMDFGIEDASLSHNFDLSRFEERVADLLKWSKNSRLRQRYMAPYFVVIQSRGMGKTKLLYEYMKKKKTEKETDPDVVAVKLLLCVDPDIFDNVRTDVHQKFAVPQLFPTTETRDEFLNQLDDIVANEARTKKPVVLLVDEAQKLLGWNRWGGNGAFYFRCFRQWLRLHDRTVVAVFAGTTTKLTNFYEERRSTTFARDVEIYFTEEGEALYEPFFELTTSGACKKEGSDKYEKDEDWDTDFVRSIPYGRPLFHIMKMHGQLDTDKLEGIKKQMQFYDYDLQDTPVAWLSVLSKRVQMGQSPPSMVSSLVEHGYANLAHFQYLPDAREGAIVRLCHFPDPVLARAAMQIMNNEQGSGHCEEWPGHARTLFSSGLCTPDKGGVGEIAAALYMLFCGDEIRKAKDPTFKAFAIPLQEWLDGMGAIPIMRRREAHEEGKSVSFIQFCRSYLRLNPGEIAKQGDFLEELHQAAYGIYLYPGAAACDILASVCCCSPSSRADLKHKSEDISPSSAKTAMEVDSSEEVNGGGTVQSKTFEALLVSVEHCQVFSCSEMGLALVNMIIQLLKAGLDRGVCLLILVGLMDDGHFSVEKVFASLEKILEGTEPELVEGLKSSSVSCYVVIVKSDDKFCIGDMLQMTTRPGGEQAESYASHFALQWLEEGGEMDHILRSGKLRKSNREYDRGLNRTLALAEALSGPPKGGQAESEDGR